MVMLNSWDARVRAASHVGKLWEASGRCLQFVDWCYGQPASKMGDLGPLPGGASNGNWQDAKQGWYGSAFKHPGDGTDAPAGVPVYWEQQRGGNPAGHIVISDGDGYCYTTDYAGARSVSRQSIAYINSLRGPALGWTDDYGNNPIDTQQEAAKPAPEPIRKKKKMTLGDLVWTTDGLGVLISSEGFQVHIPGPTAYGYFARIINSDQSRNPTMVQDQFPERFYQSELNVVTDLIALARKANSVAVPIDPVKLASALNDALKDKKITDHGLTAAELQAALDVAIPRITAKVVKDAGTALAS